MGGGYVENAGAIFYHLIGDKQIFEFAMHIKRLRNKCAVNWFF